MLTTPAETGIQLLGVPFDATSTYRPGSRFAPNAIREAFNNIEIFSRELDVDLEGLDIADGGNLPRTSNVDSMLSALTCRARQLLANGRVPAMLGGEHTVTLGAARAFPEDSVLVVFDAHFDVRDEFDGLRTMHATWLRRLLEERPGWSVVHVGARAAARAEWDYAGPRFRLLPADEAVAEDAPDRLRAHLSEDRPVYVSVDLDVLDPAYGPGVANPETGGLSTRQLVKLLHALDTQRVIGFDVVELAPAYDPSGITAVAAARALSELCCLAYLTRTRSGKAGAG